ncbi:hypothetical protein MSP8887_01028 [Marinomonas spartinae]|nr:hypothetical protein MSP8887_01028 [Marinomonas spartinae]
MCPVLLDGKTALRYSEPFFLQIEVLLHASRRSIEILWAFSAFKFF